MNYPVLQELPFDGTIYRNGHMNTLEAVLPPGAYTSHHSPALLELPDGDQLCAWFAGTYEGNTDVGIVCSRLPFGGEKWTEPQPISHDPERSEQNPSLFLAPNGEVWAMYTAQLARTEGKDNMQYRAGSR